jgi:hypothetical protein
MNMNENTPLDPAPGAFRKPRIDSHLKILPAARQKQIIDLLNSSSQTEALLAIKCEYNIDTSLAALSRFYAWWHLRHPFEQLEAFAAEAMEQSTNAATLSSNAEILQQTAFAVFGLQALKERDFGVFEKLCKLQELRRHSAIAERRLEMDEARQHGGRVEDVHCRGSIRELFDEASRRQARARKLAEVQEAMAKAAAARQPPAAPAPAKPA